ncbi:microtubule-binding protein TANGLED-like [Salvia divinorum]|uniref:Microtubule-binding protein TANGLED-like n=1 Tax=Salvia divinorum TaxID=28513 RepID=A0ABD1H0T6_SALDI
MVARSPSKQRNKLAVVAPPISPTPTLLRETVKKVGRCMARLQELQHTMTVGISDMSLNPRRELALPSLRCKQDSLSAFKSRTSPPGKLPVSTDEWRKMSLPAMLLGETVGEILQATQFARNVVQAVSSKPANHDPKTPLTKHKPGLENSSLHARRRKEKQVVQQKESNNSLSSSLRRPKSKINFKVSPLQNPECDKENCRYIANRVSPRNRPCVRKTVLFPNPLFLSSPTSQHHKFGKTKSPMIAKNRQTPHRLRRSFSPSTLASKLVSPLKSRKSLPQNNELMMKKTMSGSMRFSSPQRI